MSDIRIQNSLTGKLNDKYSFKKPFPIALELEEGEWECYELGTFQGGQILGNGKTQEEALDNFKHALVYGYEKWLKEDQDGTINEDDKNFLFDPLKEYIE